MYIGYTAGGSRGGDTARKLRMHAENEAPWAPRLNDVGPRIEGAKGAC